LAGPYRGVNVEETASRTLQQRGGPSIMGIRRSVIVVTTIDQIAKCWS